MKRKDRACVRVPCPLPKEASLIFKGAFVLPLIFKGFHGFYSFCSFSLFFNFFLFFSKISHEISHEISHGQHALEEIISDGISCPPGIGKSVRVHSFHHMRCSPASLFLDHLFRNLQLSKHNGGEHVPEVME